MAFTKLADISFTVGGTTKTYELYEDGYGGAAGDLKIVNRPEHRCGEPQQAILNPEQLHRKASVTLQVKDDSRTLLGRFQGKSEGIFRLDYKIGGTLYRRFTPLLGTERPKLAHDNPVISLQCSDGVSLLKGKTYDITGMKTAAELFQDLLDGIGHEIDVWTFFDWQHDNQDTARARAHGIRMDAEHWLKDEAERTYYDVLMDALAFFQCELMQEDGVWKVIERAARGATMDVAKAAFGGSVTKDTIDPVVALTDSALQKEDTSDPSLHAIPSATSVYKLIKHPVRNPQFNDLDGSDPRYWTMSGSANTTTIDGENAVNHDGAGDYVEQVVTESIPQSRQITVTLDLRLVFADGMPAGTSVSPELGTCILTNTPTGQDYWLDKNGAWQTSETFLQPPSAIVSKAASGPLPGTPLHEQDEVVEIYAEPAPAHGTITLKSKFDADPDDDMTDELAQIYFKGFTYELPNVEPLEEIEASADSGVNVTVDPVEEEFAFGDYSEDNHVFGVFEYLDATSAAWTKTDDWDGSGASFHEERVRKRLQQQSQQLVGLDARLVADTNITIADTLSYSSTTYVPVFESVPDWTRQRRMLFLELRSDTVTPSTSDVGKSFVPVGRPNPIYKVELEYVAEGEWDVYLEVLRLNTLLTACVQWEYLVGGSVVDSGTNAFGENFNLRFKVNGANTLDSGDTTPTLRAWAWSGISSGEGIGIRQAKIFEKDLSELVGGQPTMDDVPDGPSTYGKVALTQINVNGEIILSAVTGDLDDISDGSTYARVLSSALSAGSVLLAQASGDLDDIGNGSTYGRIKNTALSSGDPLLSAAVGDLDDVSDGSSYGRVNATSLSAGNILLVQATGDLDDISDGSSFGKVDITQLSAGRIQLVSVDGDLDDVSDGSTYGKIKNTIIAAGFIQVGTGTKDSTLSGFHVDNTEIVGQLSGADQVILNTSGQIQAGSGQEVTIDEDGIVIDAGAAFPSVFTDATVLSVGGMYLFSYVTSTGGLHAEHFIQGDFGPSDLTIDMDGSILVTADDALQILSGSFINIDSADYIELDAVEGIFIPAKVPSATSGKLYRSSNDLFWSGDKMWTAGNDGSGSGLDADTLDGVEGANYLRSNVADDVNAALTFNAPFINAVTSSPSAPSAGVKTFCRDTAGVKEYGVRFANGTVKILADDT